MKLMKRPREDNVSSQLKRPADSSRAESTGQSQMMIGSSSQRLTTNDALSYLKAVKDIFQDNKDKYEEFLQVMKDFKAQRIDTAGVIARVKELFKGNRDLILGFNAFLPKGYEITLPPEDGPPPAKKPVQFEEAFSFVGKIKNRFQGDNRVYNSFLLILNMYKNKNKSVREVSEEVAVLLVDHPDLLDEFSHFLPDISAEASVHNAQGSRNSMRWDDGLSQIALARSTHVEKKAISAYPNHDFSVERPDPDNEKASLRSDREQYRYVECGRERRHDKDQREREYSDRDSGRNGTQYLPQKQKCVRVEDSHPQGGEGAENNGIHDQELVFFQKVKEGLQKSDGFLKFMNCLQLYNNGIISRIELRKLVNDLIGTHPDLIEEFNNFLARCDKSGGYLASILSKRSLWNDGHISKPVKVEDRNRDLDHGREFRHKDQEKREKIRHDRGVAVSCQELVGQKMPSYSSKDDDMSKSLQELDLSNCERCTPSYRLLPKDYPIPSVSHRTGIGAEVLNDHWVSVTLGSEDYSFKHMRKNQYEESLFRCEDDRFEMDMLLESVNVTTRRVEELLDKINDSTTKTATSIVEDYFTTLNLRCIERLYGDHGLDVMDLLRKNAPLALPVILTRLKQKQEEWASCRSDFNQVWAEICAKNHQKSLDHRSFYFKQQDPKSLSTKALLAEIKEKSENRRSKNDVLLATGCGQSLIPDMEFEYPDPDIHEDLYQLIKFSCGEVCSTEHSDKIMKIWTTFLDKMLGVPSRPQVAEDNEDVAKDNLAESGDNVVPGSEDDIPSECSTPFNVCLKEGDNVIEDDDSHSADRIADESETSGASKQATSTEQISNSNAAGANKTQVEANAEIFHGLYATPNRPAEGGLEMRPIEDSEGDNCTRTVPSSSGAMPEGINHEERHEQSMVHFNQREEGELSQIKDIEMHEDAAKETAQDTRDPAHNVNASGSDSKDTEICSSDEPGEDGDNDENENKAETESKDEGVSDAEENEARIPEHSFQSSRPLTIYVPAKLRAEEKDCRIFYGNDAFYVLFRLHQTLYERILKVKLYSSSAENRWSVSNDMNPSDSYERFITALYNFLNGTSDNIKYEDECRSIFGTQSYFLFTLDKLIYKIVKQLQAIATVEMDNNLLQLYAYENTRNAASFSDKVYLSNARLFLHDENIYRIECSSGPTRLSIQLMDHGYDKPEVENVYMDQDFLAYLNNDFFSVADGTDKPGVYLQRNKRRNARGDEELDFCEAMEGVIIINGLVCKMSCNTSKCPYVMDTEDFFFRMKTRRRALYHASSNGHSSNGCSNGGHSSNGSSNGRKRPRILMFS